MKKSVLKDYIGIRNVLKISLLKELIFLYASEK